MFIRYTKVAAYFLSVLIFFSCMAQAAPLKTKVAILDFRLEGDVQSISNMDAIIAEWLVTAFVKSGRFDVIERRLLNKILDEQKLVMTGIVDENTATKLGKLLGVQIVVSGSVMKFQNITEVNARIIDVEGASVIAAESVKSRELGLLKEKVNEMVKVMIKEFPLEGYIIHMDGDNLSIDIGKRSGVKEGMQFLTYKDGTIIKHPQTGEVLGVEKIQTGAIEVTTIYSRMAKAKILYTKPPDNTIKYGQMVKSIIKPLTLDKVQSVSPIASAPDTAPSKPLETSSGAGGKKGWGGLSTGKKAMIIGGVAGGAALIAVAASGGDDSSSGDSDDDNGGGGDNDDSPVPVSLNVTNNWYSSNFSVTYIENGVSYYTDNPYIPIYSNYTFHFYADPETLCTVWIWNPDNNDWDEYDTHWVSQY